MPRRKSHERESDLEKINRLYLQGYSLRAIAEELGNVSHETIQNDLSEIQRRWQESTTIEIDEHKSKELARIDLLEFEYWQQYELSKEDFESITKKAKDGGSPDDKTKRGYEVTTRTENRTGNPSYLQGVERCIKMRMELLGLEAPKRQEIAGKDGKAIEINNHGTITDDERIIRIAEILEAARNRRDRQSPE